jgi:hypothetical protein
VVIGFTSLSAEHITELGETLAPNILALLPGAFDSLRLSTRAEALLAAKLALVKNLNKSSPCLLALPNEPDLALMRKANAHMRCIISPQRYFDLAKADHETDVSKTYLAGIDSLTVLFSPEAAWLCLNTCGLIGIAPSTGAA